MSTTLKPLEVALILYGILHLEDTLMISLGTRSLGNESLNAFYARAKPNAHEDLLTPVVSGLLLQ